MRTPVRSLPRDTTDRHALNPTYDDPTGRAWLDVDLDALRRNARRVAEHVAPARLLPMVKANAYGLGAVEVARALESLEPYAFGVATREEGRALRRGGIEGRIIVFAPGSALDAPTLPTDRLDAVAMSLDSLRRFDEAARQLGLPLDVHLEIDTGMGRAGLPAADPTHWIPEVSEIVSRGQVALASAFTHFHSAGEDRRRRVTSSSAFAMSSEPSRPPARPCR